MVQKHSEKAASSKKSYKEKEKRKKGRRQQLSGNCVWLLGRMHVCFVTDQPGKVANPTRGQLNKENVFFPVPVRA